MALGLGKLSKPKKPVGKKDKSPDDDAAELLKKMEEKSQSEDCPFC